MTVAMMYAIQGYEIEPWWRHDPSLKNKGGYTVADMYKMRGIKVPKEWIVHWYYLLIIKEYMKKWFLYSFL